MQRRAGERGVAVERGLGGVGWMAITLRPWATTSWSSRAIRARSSATASVRGALPLALEVLGEVAQPLGLLALPAGEPPDQRRADDDEERADVLVDERVRARHADRAGDQREARRRRCTLAVVRLVGAERVEEQEGRDVAEDDEAVGVEPPERESPASAAANGWVRRNAIGTVVSSAISTPSGARRDRRDQHLDERRDRERGGDQASARRAEAGHGRDGNRRRARKSASGLSRIASAGRCRRPPRAARFSPCPLPAPSSLILAALLALNAIGYVVALATGLVDPLPGFVNGSKTNAPLVIWGAQTLGIALLLAAAAPAAALALLACTVSLAAVAFDGDLGAAGLGAGHVAIQLAHRRRHRPLVGRDGGVAGRYGAGAGQ